MRRVAALDRLAVRATARRVLRLHSDFRETDFGGASKNDYSPFARARVRVIESSIVHSAPDILLLLGCRHRTEPQPRSGTRQGYPSLLFHAGRRK